MKKSIITIVSLICLSFISHTQTIRRVNNNPGTTGINVYTTLQAAHDAAVANDIIYVEPSSADYGHLDCRKRLTIIGNGYFNDKNANVSFDTRSSLIGNITFNNGSANSILTGIVINGGTAINDVNITITRCKINREIGFGISSNLVADQYSRGNNATITKCIIIGGNIVGNNSTIVSQQFGYNCTISNNIIERVINNMTNTTIANNTFNTWFSVQQSGYGSSVNNVFGCSVSNNIYDARNVTNTINFISGGTGNTISNNICLGANATPSNNGNVVFGDPTITYVTTNPWSTVTTEDAKFQLATSNSPAAGIGIGGTNAGALGGSNPYILSGQPAYPIITSYLPAGIGNANTPLSVSVTIRSNN